MKRNYTVKFCCLNRADMKIAVVAWSDREALDRALIELREPSWAVRSSRRVEIASRDIEQ